MSPEFEALRKNKSAFTAVVAAALGFALFCLVGAAILMGWIGPGVHNASTPPPRPAATTQADEMGLSPGETVVAPAEVPAPPAKVATPPPAITTAPATAAPASAATPSAPKAAEPKRPRRPHYAAPRRAPGEPAAPRPRSQSPAVAQEAPHPTDTDDRWPQPACGSCGAVESVRVFPDLWEVRVRFDDGAHRTIRYSRPQHWHVGDRIRYEGGHLVPE